jgi:hypothetical protein
MLKEPLDKKRTPPRVRFFYDFAAINKGVGRIISSLSRSLVSGIVLIIIAVENTIKNKGEYDELFTNQFTREVFKIRGSLVP